MGQEHSGKGKQILLRITGCLSIVLGLCGCVHLLNQWQGEQDLREAKQLMRTGQYSESEAKTMRVLESFPKTLGDEALFQMGLFYSLPKNPTADYEKSRVFFERLVTQYAGSSRKQEAEAWLLALTSIIDNEKESLELQKKVKLLEQTSESRGKMVRQLQEESKDRKRETTQDPDKKLRQLQEELEDRKKEIIEYLETVNQLQNRVIELESQLAKFKSIDLTIEQKKRGNVP
jgi:flagellar biosynthesis/type III secretory pathway chaperone